MQTKEFFAEWIWGDGGFGAEGASLPELYADVLRHILDELRGGAFARVMPGGSRDDDFAKLLGMASHIGRLALRPESAALKSASFAAYQ